jgi:hypothetical protein
LPGFQAGFDGTGTAGVSIDVNDVASCLELLNAGASSLVTVSGSRISKVQTSVVYRVVHAHSQLISSIRDTVHEFVLERKHHLVPAAAIGRLLEFEYTSSRRSGYVMYVLNPNVSSMVTIHGQNEIDSEWRAPQYWYGHDEDSHEHGWRSGSVDPTASCGSSLWISNTSRIAFYDVVAGTPCALGGNVIRFAWTLAPPPPPQVRFRWTLLYLATASCQMFRCLEWSPQKVRGGSKARLRPVSGPACACVCVFACRQSAAWLCAVPCVVSSHDGSSVNLTSRARPCTPRCGRC